MGRFLPSLKYSSPRGFRALKRGLTFNYITNNLKKLQL